MPPAPSSGSPLDFDHEAYRVGEGAAYRQWAREGVRTLHEPLGGSGLSDTVRLQGETLMTVLNCVLGAPVRWRYEQPDEALIMLRASLSCDVGFRVGDGAPVVFNRPEVTLVCVPPGGMLQADVVAGVRQQGVVALMRASGFAQRFGLQPQDLPPIVRDAVLGRQGLGRLASFPIDPRIAALVSEAIDSRLDGELRRVQLEGLLTQLVALTLDAMQRTPLLRDTGLKRLRDVELAHAAMQRLEHEYQRPPSFADLALAVGTNQNKLKAVFKEAFGVTMADYCLERRMREAQQLLLEARLTIAQVAERVGYEHQSSFTAAFRRHVGMSPREYRKHRPPVSVPLGAIGAIS